MQLSSASEAIRSFGRPSALGYLEGKRSTGKALTTCSRSLTTPKRSGVTRARKRRCRAIYLSKGWRRRVLRLISPATKRFKPCLCQCQVPCIRQL